MNKLLFGLAALLFLAGVASATERLSDAQLDRVTAGLTGTCPGAGCSSSTTTVNGITTTTNTTGFTINVNPQDFQALLQSFYAYLTANGFPTTSP